MTCKKRGRPAPSPLTMGKGQPIQISGTACAAPETATGEARASGEYSSGIFVDRKLASSEPVWPRDELDLRRKSGWRARLRTLTREKTRGLQAAPRNGIWYSRSCARRDWRNVRVPELQTEQNGRVRETGSAR